MLYLIFGKEVKHLIKSLIHLQDRKTLQEFNLKDFLFDAGPAEWNFDAKEELKGCPQMIDITDDCTGTPHRVAKDNIPMVRIELFCFYKLIRFL